MVIPRILVKKPSNWGLLINISGRQIVDYSINKYNIGEQTHEQNKNREQNYI